MPTKRQLIGTMTVLVLLTAEALSPRAAFAQAQGAPPTFPGAPAAAPAPAGDVLGAGPFIHLVTDLDRTLAFYQDLLGITATAPAFAANPPVARMYNAPGAEIRSATLQVPHSDLLLEFIEWRGAPASPPIAARVFDTGATNILLRVRELERARASALAHGGSIVNPTGKPVVTPGSVGGTAASTAFLIVKDPDGYFVELIDAYAEAATPEAGNVVSVLFRFIADDAARTAAFFEKAFGFEVSVPGELARDAVLGEMTGLGVATSRFARSVVPGSTVVLQIGEIKAPGSRRLAQALPRVGSSMFRLYVRDVDAMFARAKAAGAVTTPGNEQPITLSDGRRMVVVAEPDGLLIQLAQAAPSSRPAAAR